MMTAAMICVPSGLQLGLCRRSVMSGMAVGNSTRKPCLWPSTWTNANSVVPSRVGALKAIHWPSGDHAIPQKIVV